MTNYYAPWPELVEKFPGKLPLVQAVELPVNRFKTLAFFVAYTYLLSDFQREDCLQPHLEMKSSAWQSFLQAISLYSP